MPHLAWRLVLNDQGLYTEGCDEAGHVVLREAVMSRDADGSLSVNPTLDCCQLDAVRQSLPELRASLEALDRLLGAVRA